MCVSQFRDFCKVSKFNHSNYESDLKDKSLIVKKGTKWYNGRPNYYVTDLKKLKQLAKLNNEYAIKALENLKQ